MLSAVLHQEPLPLPALPALEGIVRRCLAKRPVERFQSMSEVRKALESISCHPVEPQPSVAVLPFSTMSSDKEDEYFSDGLAEEIINALAHIPGLDVTARTSSFSFRGKDLDIRKVAEALGVRTILEGSVRRLGNRIRVTTQLINAANGYHLWSERFDREMSDVFAIQDEIAQAIASSLEVRLSPGVGIVRQHTPDIAAYELFLKARYLLRKGTPESLSRGKECLEQAIALDPDFASAHAELAWYFESLTGLFDAPAVEALPRARAAAQRALRLDPSLPEAHAELAAVALFLDYDWAVAGHHFRLAMARDPIPPSVSHHYGFYYLLPLGRILEATEELERALKEDPLNLLCRTQFAVCHWAAGNNEEASRQFRQVLELDESFWLALLLQAIWHSQEGSVEQALASAERAYAVASKNPCSIGALAGVLSRSGKTKRAEQLVEELGDGSAYGTPHGFVLFHIVRLEFDQAADWAEKMIEQRDPSSLPATSHINRRHFVANGRWPSLARMLRLPETATG